MSNAQLEKLETALIMLLRDQGKVFYAALMMQMIRCVEEKIPSIGVSIQYGRIYLHYNPKFVEKRTVPELVAIMEHEVLHLVMEHPFRVKDRDHKIWNIAADMAINQMIQNLPKDACLPGLFKLPADKHAEYYYAELLKRAKEIEVQCPGCSSSGTNMDDHGKWGQSGKMDQDLEKEIVRRAIADAYEQHMKKQGKLPGSMEEMIKEWLKRPEVPWQQLLRQYVGRAVKANYKLSWKRPSRRFNQQKGHIPERVLQLAVAIDTSGSIDTREFQEFATEIKGIQKCYRNETTILECDAEVQKFYKLKPYKRLDMKFKGRGGTDFSPVFAWFEKNRKYKPDLLVYFTDLYGSFPNKTPDYPTLWVVSSNGANGDQVKVPFGGLIRIKKQKKSRDD